MKVKMGYYVLEEKEIEIDDKWKKLADICVKDLNATPEENKYYYDNIKAFCDEIDTQTGIDWQFITTLDGLPIAEM